MDTQVTTLPREVIKRSAERAPFDARKIRFAIERAGSATGEFAADEAALLAAQDADTQPIQDLLAWLPEHLAEDLSIPKLAAVANLSERHFSRRFKAEVGVGPGEHVEAVRLESACRLLESTQLTIEQLAHLCGFGAVETMNRAFRRRLGTTPIQHRHHFNHALAVSAMEDGANEP